jgi:HK97 family phage portal protein
MGIFNRNKKAPVEEKRSIDEWVNPVVGTLNYSTFGSYNNSRSMKISTVYRCMNLISDSIASLPLIPYTFRGDWKYIDETNSLYNILNVQPNSYMSAYMLKKLAVLQMLSNGNAYIYIDKEKTGQVKSLTLLNPSNIELLLNGASIGTIVDVSSMIQEGNLDITYHNMVSGKVYDKTQIIHLINYPDANGLMGFSTLSYAATVLGNAYYTDAHSSQFFQSGANLGGILRPVAGVNLLKGQAAKAKQDFINALSPSLGGTSGGVVALDAGLEYQPIAINPRDSQMIENKEFNVLEICRFFGVPPSLAFSETGKFSTAEQQGLDFLNNGLLPVVEKMENEIFRKCYLPSEWINNELRFDVDNLIRLDATTKIDVLTKQIAAGVKTPNEGRAIYNMASPVKGGNKAFISTNLQTLDAPAVTGGKPEKEEKENNTINNIAK